MARISEDTIAQVAAANDVVEVIGTYLQLKRAGSSWRGLCPFH
ncbi:MAG: CHC2 zinc finger domain-containing protein, partial [Chthoniobacterales bacterium]